MLRWASRSVLSGAASSFPSRGRPLPNNNLLFSVHQRRCGEACWGTARRGGGGGSAHSGVLMASGNTRDALTPTVCKHSATIDMPSGELVHITGESCLSSSEFRHAIDSALFKNWLKNSQSPSGILNHERMSLKSVHIQGVDMFGRGVGFLKFKADVFDNESGKKVPGIVFARGQSVAVLIILDSGGEDYVVLTEQARVPVGRLILELPAGMLDDEGCDIVGTAVREVEEETGISLRLADMINLTQFLDPSTGCRVFPSPGGCDEEISLFLYRGRVEEGVIAALQGKQMGLQEHGELIKVRVVPYQTLWRATADAKALTAIALYEMTKREGLIPLPSGELMRDQPKPGN